eukprot:CAMPEP_0202712720 /NCGR_PEP_ID=MMETSP1385-20130828/44496_1 /ASSEMBLY_ACC=CAM_ASM_000861 /TAXON_ID=933848 /ORGANISM="Elphidium margaritaceum" /LENGTH=558 /DNA_ID=CAMNT_0049372831 /DNA_START=28 /DNA_END=1704 /DNA_ORIENTATION=+
MEEEEEEEGKSSSSSGSDVSDSDDELARQRIPDEDPRWQSLTHDHGVKKIVLHKGWGKPAPDGSDASIRYVGRFQDTQRVFEDNTKQNPPFKFLVGHFRVIRALDIAVQAMQIGEKCILRTSARWAYGEKGEGRKIAPNKDLDYELEVVDWSDWKRVNNRDDVRKRVLNQGEGDMYDVPDASAICDITYTAQVGEDDDAKYAHEVFSCGRHIGFMVDDDPTFPAGLHEAVKSMNKYEIAEFKVMPALGYGEKGAAELGIAGNAILCYRVHMHNYQNLMSRWKMEPEQLFEVGQRFKDKAREYFELGDYNYAFQRYEKALEYFEADEKMDAQEKQEAGKQILLVHNNLAMIHLKRGEYVECVRECNKVLSVHRTNVKAWCRKGQSRMMLSEYKKAHEDLKYALSLDVDNTFIKKMLRQNRKLKQRYVANQKKLYGGMFDRYNQAMKDKKQSTQSQQSQKPTTKLNVRDIDDYDNEDSESQCSIAFSDFNFDDMDDGDAADNDEHDDDDDDGDDGDDGVKESKRQCENSDDEIKDIRPPKVKLEQNKQQTKELQAINEED